ncbi:MAG: hypothetical protein WCR67_03155 [Bacilli bacterium]
MKKITKILTISLSIVAILAIPASQITLLYTIPSQFDETYYGEFAHMYHKVKDCQGKKIVIVGNSNVAFGVDSALLEKQLRADGLDYSVCNYGLYISLGTKFMLDTVKNQIKKDDIVIFTPELISQAMSLYYSSKEVWYALDSDLSLLSTLDNSCLQSQIGSMNTYIGEKYEYFVSGNKAQSGTTYSQASFDDNCDFKNSPRAYNTMENLYDSNTMLSFSTDLLTDSFISYVNTFYQDISAKGAKMYYSFAPMNFLSIKLDNFFTDINNFSDALDEKLDFPIISSPFNYIMNPGWFFDANVHLNEAGMTFRTNLLASDIKNQFSITTPNTLITVPEMPEVPITPVDTDGDNSDLDCFEYETSTDSVRITSLSNKGRTESEIIVPTSYNSLPITGFDASVFQNNLSLRKLTIQKNIKTLADYSFSGSTNIQGIYLTQTDPESLGVGFNLLENCPTCYVYVPTSSFSKYLNNYYWGHYAAKIQKY